MAENMVIGLSLSECVKDIANGKMDYNRVKVIWAGVRCSSTADWLHVARTYIINKVWDEDVCLMVFERLLRDGKVFQPRLVGLDTPNISDGHWYWDTSEDKNL